jgi:SAM-dependent methyltransferase
MPASGSIYDSARLARGYAFDRPPVHPLVARMIAEHLGITAPTGRALDVGCGAGRSTEALGPLAASAVGLEPVRAMLAHRHDVAPAATFVVGRAEALPFKGGAFGLLTAAGSLNYADLSRFLPDAARVLAPGGVLVVYDFSAGRRFREDDALDRWFAAFERRWPFPPEYDLDVRTVDLARHGLRLANYHEYEVALPIGLEAYLRYVLSETNVEQAIVDGVPAEEIRDRCRRGLEPLFGAGTREVLFTGYVAYIAHAR